MLYIHSKTELKIANSKSLKKINVKIIKKAKSILSVVRFS